MEAALQEAQQIGRGAVPSHLMLQPAGQVHAEGRATRTPFAGSSGQRATTREMRRIHPRMALRPAAVERVLQTRESG